MNKKTFCTGSGLTVTIREHNGQDDDVLSNVSEPSESIQAQTNYLAGIIQEIRLPDGQTFKPSDGDIWVERIKKLKSPDRYYILIASRIFSMGHELVFKFAPGNKTCKSTACPFAKEVDVTEDLRIFMLEKGEPKDSSVKHYSHPHGSKDSIEFITNSGKKLRYYFANSETDMYYMKLDRTSINDDIRARGLEMETSKDKWEKVNNFMSFTSMDMKEIRSHILKNDPEWLPMIYIKCSTTGCNQEYSLPVTHIRDFFYPVMM